ncbi:BnaC04g05530D [Brassica napus]|uniref:BnaC04g05530D protein n=1 Tax=Brassica napus TaxID=3708 RepID=A0A078G4Y6_BRANA|nr:BnaC04g05530D [Brassica napus]
MFFLFNHKITTVHLPITRILQLNLSTIQPIIYNLFTQKNLTRMIQSNEAFLFQWYMSSSSIILRADKTHMMSNLHMCCRYSIIIQPTVKNK